MGLLDILNGMQNGPRGQADPNAKGGMSPMTMAILALLAYKAFQKIRQPSDASTGVPAPSQPGNVNTGGVNTGGLGDILGNVLGGSPAGGRPATNPTVQNVNASGGGLNDLLGSMLGGAGGAGAGSGGLADLLKGGLGSLLAGGAAGSVLNGGLGDLLNQLHERGQGDAANSWVGAGPNRAISANELGSALNDEEIEIMTRQTGLSREELLEGLAANLPEAVNQMTPQGRVPTDKEFSSWL